MAFVRLRTSRTTELIPLLDIIFILIMYGVVVGSIEMGIGGGPIPPLEDGLTIEFDHTGVDRGLVVMIYFGSDTAFASLPMYPQLSQMPAGDSHAELKAFELIRNKLGSHAEVCRNRNTISPVRLIVPEDIAFQIVNTVVDLCSIHTDVMPYIDIGTK